MSELDEKRVRLLELIRSFESVAVAFSAGVDSTVVAKAAQLALGDAAVAVTGTSASLAAGELDQARSLAEQIGMRHVVIETDEFSQPSYTQNAPDRCYHCKTELYTRLDQLADRLGVRVALNGANLDDAGDYRPGMRAAAEHEVRSPLADCGFTKADVRALAAVWELPVADKPATPCLASRVAYGEEVTAQRLRMIDEAEQFLRGFGLREVRVRYHRGALARIEVPREQLVAFAEAAAMRQIDERLRQLGFRYVTIDLAGFQSGSMNAAIVPLQVANRP